jgi:general secretion pathway protein M
MSADVYSQASSQNSPQTSAQPTGLREQALTWWHARALRERQAVTVVGLVVGFFVIWSSVVQPALNTVRTSPAQLDKLEMQHQKMQQVAAESASLRGAPRVSSTQAVQALKAASERLGDKAKLVVQGDRATLTLTNLSPDALRGWLIEVRAGARARPVEVQLQRSPQGYSGTLGLALGGTS